jgi:hypothetical protein
MPRHRHWRILVPPSLFLLLSVPATGAGGALPPDIRAFQKDRQSCEHFRGEEPTDAERKQFIDAALARYCTGTDQRLAALKRKYAGNKAALKALSRYNVKIE